MRAKVVSVAIDPTALQHGTLTGTGQWQLSIKTNAHTLTCTIAESEIKITPIIRKEMSHAVIIYLFFLQLTLYN